MKNLRLSPLRLSALGLFAAALLMPLLVGCGGASGGGGGGGAAEPLAVGFIYVGPRGYYG